MNARVAFELPFEYHIIKDTNIVLQVDEATRTATSVQASVSTYNGHLLHSARLDLGSEVACRRYAKTVAEKTERRNKDAKNDQEKINPLDAGLVFDKLTEMAVALKREVDARLAAQGSSTGAEPAGMSEEEAAALWERVKELAEEPDLLNIIDQALARLVVGEEKNRQLVYLALTARVLAEPVCVFVKGVSSGGKSHVVLRVMQLFPDDAILDYTSMSDHYLVYTDHDLRHRIVLLLEANGLAEGTAAYIMRTLISERRIKYGTVAKGEDGGMVAVDIIKPGPTGFVSTTTKGMSDFELENRVLTLTIDDTTQQTKHVLERQGQQAAQTLAPPPDLGRFIDLQRWLAAQDVHDVQVPFAPVLAGLMPAATVRVRRDFPQVLSLIKACALLYQAQRAKTADGLPIAELKDYAVVHDLLAAPFSAAQADGVTDKQREVVDAIAKLKADHPDGVSLAALAVHLDVSKSAVNQRLRNLLVNGYVQNLNAGRKGVPARFEVGDPLPPRQDNLPDPQAVSTALAAEQAGAHEEEEDTWQEI